jgi:hypothetical protein
MPIKTKKKLCYGEINTTKKPRKIQKRMCQKNHVTKGQC